VVLLGSVKLEVSVAPGSGQFEVCDGGNLVVSGRVYIPSASQTFQASYSTAEQLESVPEGSLRLNSEDIYKELRLRGYDYGPTFQGIVSASTTGKSLLLLLIFHLSTKIRK